jgi:hypothetical protein
MAYLAAAFCIVLNTPVLLVFLAVFLLLLDAALFGAGAVACGAVLATLVLSTYSECICGAELTKSCLTQVPITLLHSAKAWLANRLVNKMANAVAFNLVLQLNKSGKFLKANYYISSQFICNIL